MASIDYTTVFDAAHAAPSWVLVIPLTMVCFGSFLLVSAAKGLPAGTVYLSVYVFPLLFSAIPLLWLGFMAHNYWQAATAARDGNCRRIEGVIEEFRPTVTGKGGDYFRIGADRFDYSDAELLGAFNQTARQGGPIRLGQHVRICEWQNEILRLEIATVDLAKDVVEPSHTGWLLLLLLPIFSFVWFAAVRFVPKAQIFERYPVISRPTGEGFPLQAMRIGAYPGITNWDRGRVIANVSLGDQHVWLTAVLGRPPGLQIPWEKITACERVQRLFNNGLQITLADNCKFTLWGAAAKAIEARWKETSKS